MNSRPPIAFLPPAVVERVAAGEAIERPAAAVKELIENALDADATEIGVEITSGGLALIRVADDGHGIAPSDVELIGRRHATSKRAALDELERIGTLGFRGEALASLAAVADLSVVSATEDADVGRQVTFRDGEQTAVVPIARRRGTTATIRRLFAAVPARRKFLGSTGAETARVLEVVRQHALAHPAVRFSVVADARLQLRTTGSGRAEVALGECWGAAVRRGLLPLEPPDVPGMTIGGWIGDRTTTRPNRAGIVVAVNGRPVQVVGLQDTIEAAYRPMLPRGRHPFLLVQIGCDPREVDVNVHPAKVEVLLRRRAEAGAAIAQAVRAALTSVPDRPDGASWAVEEDRPALPLGRPAGRRVAEPGGDYGDERRQASSGRQIVGALPRMLLLGQVQRTLIAVESDAGLYLVDQHRAHERVLYERLAAQGGPMAAQTLLEPVTLELRAADAERFAGRLEQLGALGFHLERISGLVYLVHAVPSIEGAVSAVPPPPDDDEVWRQAMLPGDNWLDRLRTAVACRSALRRGQPLSVELMQRLLQDLAGAQSPAVCPHGSPLILEVTASFLARQFDWR